MKSERAHSMLVKEYSINREYSFLLFNKRVLDQAMDLTNPLIERSRFLSIYKSNLDEFTQVRVGTLENEVSDEPDHRDSNTGLTASEQLEAIIALYPGFYHAMDETFRFLWEDLRAHGIDITKPGKLTDRQSEEASRYFIKIMLPRINPMVLDQKHPLVNFWSLRTYLIVLLERDGEEMFATASLSPGAERIYELRSGKRKHLMTSEDLLYTFGHLAFPGYTVKEKSLVRITRNADFDAPIDEADEEYGWDFSSFIHKKVENRGIQPPVRIEMNSPSVKIREFLMNELGVKRERIFRSGTYFDFRFFFRIGAYLTPSERGRLSYRPFKAYEDPELMKGSVIEEVEKRDILLSYPYCSIEPLLKLLDEASTDPTVTDIRITIYRLSSNSRICDALMKARSHGKEVTALTELCARFDEENNIHYANLLRNAGCTVYYGLDDFKVHSKIISIKRMKDGHVSYITHIGTGNYNETTAAQYTDMNIITSDSSIGEDGETFFRSLALKDLDAKYERFLVSPRTLRSGLLSELEKEEKKGSDGFFRAKFNSLTDREVIDALISASRKGVRIRLCVRGLCALVPGIPGVSENISVISIVGRFLEHSRIYAFGRGDDERIYISSADMMHRNLSKRVEIACPVLSPEIRKVLSSELDTVLSDNVKARALGEDGVYRKLSSLDRALNSQEELLKRYGAYGQEREER